MAVFDSKIINGRVLMVDGDPLMRDHFAAVIEPLKISHAADINQGIALAHAANQGNRPFAVAFVDAGAAASFNGIATVQRLWKDDPRLQIVLCTDSPSECWTSVTQCLGLSDSLLVLKKPFSKEDAWQLARVLASKWNLARAAERAVDPGNQAKISSALPGVSKIITDMFTAAAASDKPSDDDAAAPLDLTELLGRCMGNVDFLQRLLEKFRHRLGEDVGQLSGAVHAHDGSKTAILAHSLRGSASNVSATSLARLAQELEQLGVSGDFIHAEQCLTRIRQEIDRCINFVPGALDNTATKIPVKSDSKD